MSCLLVVEWCTLDRYITVYVGWYVCMYGGSDGGAWGMTFIRHLHYWEMTNILSLHPWGTTNILSLHPWDTHTFIPTPLHPTSTVHSSPTGTHSYSCTSLRNSHLVFEPWGTHTFMKYKQFYSPTLMGNIPLLHLLLQVHSCLPPYTFLPHLQGSPSRLLMSRGLHSCTTRRILGRQLSTCTSLYSVHVHSVTGYGLGSWPDSVEYDKGSWSTACIVDSSMQPGPHRS